MSKLGLYAVAEIFILAAGGVFCYAAYNDLDVEYRIDGTILLNDQPWYPVGVGFIPCPNQRDTGDFLDDIENLGRGFCFQEFADDGGNFLIFPCFHLNEPEPYNPPYFHYQDYMPCDVTDNYDTGEPNQCELDLDAAATAGIKIIGAPSLAYKWDHLVEFYPPYCRFMQYNDENKKEGLYGGVVGSGEERNTQSRTEYFNTVKQLVVNSGSEEAFLGWANCWEAVGYRNHTYLHQVHEDLRALETASSAKHPVYLEVNEVARLADLYPVTNTACDILGFNIRICPTPYLWDHDSGGTWGWNTYILNNRWTSITGDTADMHLWSVGGAKTSICCADGVWWRAPTYPFPPKEQIRFMSYDAIIHRVNGLYWGLYHYIFPEFNPKCPDDGYKDSVKPVVNELGSPLAEGGVKELLTAEFDDTALEVVVRKAGAVVERTAFLGGNLAPKNHYCSGRYLLEGCVKYRDEPVGPGIKRFVYLIAACREGRDTVTRQPVNNYDVTFRPYYSGAWPVNNVEVVNENRTVNVVNGAFTDTFQGESVHIYKFEKPTRFGD